MFQFLLGRLETIQLALEEAVIGRFQFLLGRLETVRPGPGRGRQGRVSIPLR